MCLCVVSVCAVCRGCVRLTRHGLFTLSQTETSASASQGMGP